jgi:pilus assembly protein Flp/PilA
VTRAFLAVYNDRKGVTAVEYGLIAGLIAVAIIGAISLVGTDLTNLFTKVANNLSA